MSFSKSRSGFCPSVITTNARNPSQTWTQPSRSSSPLPIRPILSLRSSLCCVVRKQLRPLPSAPLAPTTRMTRSQGLAMRQATAVLTTSGTPNSARIPPAISELDPRISCVSFRLSWPFWLMWLAIWPTWLLCFHFDHRHAFSRIPFQCFLPYPYSVSRSRPPRRHRIFPTRHSAHQQMSQSLTTQSNRTLSYISNTGSTCSRNSDRVMCPLLLLVMASLESVAQQAPTLLSRFFYVKWPFARHNEQFSTLQNSTADMQRQLRELTIITSRTTEWMRSFETHSNDIDKSLDSLRERLDAMQSVRLTLAPAKDCRFHEL